MKNLVARLAVTAATAAVASAVLTAGGISTAADGIGWPKAASTTTTASSIGLAEDGRHRLRRLRAGRHRLAQDHRHHRLRHRRHRLAEGHRRLGERQHRLAQDHRHHRRGHRRHRLAGPGGSAAV
jgi:hypothetical protein